MEDKKARILVVDDEPEVVGTLKHFLSLKGYEAVGAHSAEAALEILEKEKVDLVLLDLMMPGIGGAEAARIIKEKYPDIKLIVVTGYPIEGEILAKEKLLEGLLLKPIRIQEVHDKLLEVLIQEDNPALDKGEKASVQARVLLLKARVLFVEGSADTYNFLQAHLKKLALHGENFEMSMVDNEAQLREKAAMFNPDIIAVNASSEKYSAESIFKILEENKLIQKELIVYNAANAKDLSTAELERLTRAIQASCLKNGLLEIKWVEI